jgi:hypothetical protein
VYGTAAAGDAVLLSAGRPNDGTAEISSSHRTAAATTRVEVGRSGAFTRPAAERAQSSAGALAAYRRTPSTAARRRTLCRTLLQ